MRKSPIGEKTAFVNALTFGRPKKARTPAAARAKKPGFFGAAGAGGTAPGGDSTRILIETLSPGFTLTRRGASCILADFLVGKAVDSLPRL